MLYDQAKIYVEGGRGGNGSVSFRREAHVPRGGPDGGDGGHGGDVVLVCDPSRRDLAALARSPHRRAKKGQHGQGSGKHGARGEDMEIIVPPGTRAETVDGSIVELLEPGQRAVVARGGRGGAGNKRFATSTRQAPRFAERGTVGEDGWIELRLRLLADAGLIGLPNAGKSSLLARLTRAAPKVAGYPFTTLEPILGTLEADDRQIVLADIPGLIEGAAEGAGLGHEFLAHIERCKMLIHLVDVAPDEGEPRANYDVVRAELASHGAGLEDLPEMVVLSKADLLTPEAREEVLAEWRGRAEPDPADDDDAPADDVLLISSATGEGLDDLRRAVLARVPAVAPAPRAAAAPAGFEAEHRVYRPAGEGGYSVEREDDAFRIAGRGVEILFARHDLSNPEALSYLEQRLAEMGVLAALKAAGFEPGDEVRIGEEEFELHPGA